jgi:hypothetical protein
LAISGGSNLLVGEYGGRLWEGSFPLPGQATNPDPADTETSVDFSDYTLDWDSGGNTDTYNVYIGSSPATLSLVATGETGTSLIVPEEDRLSKVVSTWYWRVDAVNGYGTTTGDVWSFEPLWAPEIVTQTSGGPYPFGSGVELSVTVTGTSPFTYQWKKNGVIISGATSSTYMVYVTEDATYTCTITNAGGSVSTSDMVILAVGMRVTYNILNMQLDIDRGE